MRRLASTWRAFRGWISGYATTVCQSALSGRPCSAHRLTSFVRRKGVFDQEVGRSGGGSGTLSASGAPAEARARGARLQRLWAAGRGPARTRPPRPLRRRPAPGAARPARRARPRAARAPRPARPRPALRSAPVSVHALWHLTPARTLAPARPPSKKHGPAGQESPGRCFSIHPGHVPPCSSPLAGAACVFMQAGRKAYNSASF